MKRKATAYHALRPGAPAVGELSVSGGAVVFEGPGVSHRLALEGLRCRVGGVSNQIVYLSHEQEPGLEIVCEDLTLLDQPPLSEVESVRRALETKRGYRRRFWGCGISTLLLGVLGLLALLLLLASLVGWILRI